MITPKMEEVSRLCIGQIEESSLDLEDKTQLIEQIRCSLDACNGVPEEQKIQALAENAHSTAVTLAKIMMMIKETKVDSWRDVVYRCRREIMWIAFGVCGLLIFHPEIAGLLRGLAE